MPRTRMLHCGNTVLQDRVSWRHVTEAFGSQWVYFGLSEQSGEIEGSFRHDQIGT